MRLKAIGAAVSRLAHEYRYFAAVLLATLLLSFPAWWLFDTTAYAVATNVFASILVVPILLFGVEAALKRLESRRILPRARAIRSALDLSVIRLLHEALSGATKETPTGFISFITGAVGKGNDVKTIVAGMDDRTAKFVVDNADAVGQFLRQRAWEITDLAVRGMLQESKALQDMLWFAQDAASPKDFATAFELHEEVADLEMSRFMAAQEIGGKINDAFVPEVRASVADRLAKMAETLAELHISLSDES